MLYNFKDKDPIIHVLHNLIDTRAKMEGMKFGKTLREIERETKGEVKYATLYGWFVGGTRYPRYATVAKLYLSMRAYIRRPLEIGDTETPPAKLRVVRRKAA